MKSKLRLVTIDELLDMTFEPNIPLIENILYRGTYIVAGSPKVGKSFFMFQIAYHVASGTNLWGLSTKKRKVLYLALEDILDRVQSRYAIMNDVDTSSISQNLIFSNQANFLGEGFIEEIEEFLLSYNDVGLIIIDTLARIRNPSNNILSYSTDYATLNEIKSLSDKFNLTILIVHHTRKLESNDPFDMISGTNGLMGAADGSIIIEKKKRTDSKAILSIVGRDQPPIQIEIAFDVNKFRWNPTTELSFNKIKSNPLLDVVDKFLIETWQGTATELLNELNLPDLTPHTLTRKLNAKSSILMNEYGISYVTKHHKERLIFLKRITTDANDANDDYRDSANSEDGTQ